MAKLEPMDQNNAWKLNVSSFAGQLNVSSFPENNYSKFMRFISASFFWLLPQSPLRNWKMSGSATCGLSQTQHFKRIPKSGAAAGILYTSVKEYFRGVYHKKYKLLMRFIAKFIL